jgi:hypothetical protein
MDALAPLLITALSRIADGSLGEAGAKLWDSLLAKLDRTKHPGYQVSDRVVPAELDGASAADAAALLSDWAARDVLVEQSLRAWLDQVRTISDELTNTVIGDNHGKIVQARDIENLNL